MIRLGLIGLGRWGTNIAHTLKEFPEVELITEAVDSVQLDGVLIATPGSTHAEVAEPFIAKGLAVFVEKPFTTSLVDAERLHKLASESVAVVQVGHLHLFNPAYQATKKLVQAGGKLYSLLFEGMNNGPYRDDMSALWDWAPHDVAVLLDLFGELPQSVQAWGFDLLRPNKNLLDAATIRYTFSSGVAALSVVSWLSPEKRKKITFIGEQDSVVFDDTAGRKVTLYKNIGPKVFGASVEKQEPVISQPAYSTDAPLKLELEAFVKAVKTRTVPVAGLQHAVDSVRVLDAAERSIKLDGQLVKL